MTKKRIKSIKLHFNKSHLRKITIHKKRMPLVKCICGSEILVLPDLKAMNLAIENHITNKHKTTPDGSERLMEFLVEQVLLVATKINVSNLK